MSTAISVRNLRKVYPGQPPVVALADASLEIQDNEFFTLLGPSGCGKTTLLRLIAGFEHPTSGALDMFGEDLLDLPPYKRPVNTVFQSYALFPHLTVAQNIGFGLEMLGRPKAEIKATVEEMMELVKMTEMADRQTGQISGGQQQRVALARALAPKPKVLLLDEPLSALDFKLRKEMQLELKRLQTETGITFIFVTHDQEEALTMSDRIAVIEGGQVQQVGSARDIYEAPKNKFVADFIGETNLLEVTVTDLSEGMGSCILPGGAKITCPAADGAHAGPGHLSVRPERIAINTSDGGLVQGNATRHIYLGTDVHVEVTLTRGEKVTVRMQNSAQIQIPEVGQAVGLEFEADAARLLVD